MGYLEDFQAQINNRDFSKFMQLWEEYCSSDNVEAEEFIELLKAIKASDFAKLFGQFVETALPLWKTLTDEKESYHVLKHLIDLQTTNTPLLAETALEALQKQYGQPLQHAERLRLIGLRNRDNFQGALSNYDLLAHMEQGKFVFHTGGWGTGEIMEISPVREQLTIEFENVTGRKHINFVNAFKTLIPLPDDHFLSRRFSNPDLLEKEAKEDPLSIVKLFLRDLGPKTAAEIKEEFAELIIPEEEWSKWWQATRSKAKKDSIIEIPDSTKGLFRLRKTEVSHEDRLKKAIDNKAETEEILQASYSFVRDLPAILKKESVKRPLEMKLISLLDDPKTSKAQELQILILLDSYFSYKDPTRPLVSFIDQIDDVNALLNLIEILALKKKVLSLIRENRQDWVPLFRSLLFSLPQSALREYIVKELNQESRALLISELQDLLAHPAKNPEFFFWYFQKILSKDNDDLPFSDKEGQILFFEAFFILFSSIELKPEYKDLTKKMYGLITAKRYEIVRKIIEGTSIEFIKEFLLLTSKCQTLTDHDLKILRSLAEVIHPSLAATKVRKNLSDSNVIWTTEAGYLKTQERARQVGTVEIIENAREIEAARALGDLRENSEYKFALERRSRLQSELKTLSDQLNHARLITREDISSTQVGIGNVVEIEDQKGKRTTYTILGPWDADPENHVVSFQSKFVQTMIGLRVGEKFQFRDDEFKVVSLKSYLDEK